jgi:ABC-type glycerol-3-phosphate transport system substrate-binding protein
VHPEVAGTVQFAHVWDGPRVSLVEGMIADMAASYPSVRVQSEAVEPASARDRLVTALASGSPPNAVMLKSDSIAHFAERGALLPLDALLARDEVRRDSFSPTELSSRSWDGRVYGLPQASSGAQHLLFVNLGLLERIGVDPKVPLRTWQDLEALVQPAANEGLLVMDPGRMAVGMTAHQVWTYANGGRYWDADLRKVTWNEPAGLQAAEWLVQFVAAQAGDYAHLASSGDPRTSLSATEWAAERYLCCVNGAGWFFDLQQEGQRIRYAAYELPRNGENSASSGESPTTGGWSLAIPKASRDHEAAWEWLKLATVSESACAFSARQRRPSPLVGCDERAGLQSVQPFWPAISASMAKSVPVPSSPIQPQLEQIYRQMQDDLLMGRLAPADALNGAARDAQQLLDDWHARRKRP